MSLKKDYVIEKRNLLNEIRSNSMTLQELRFFSIYLAKINPRDIRTRVVRFSLADFQKIMELGKLNLIQLRNSVDLLLCKIIGVPNENGGFSRFQLFKKCNFDMDEHGDWYIEIDAHDDALPLMFEFKEKYFTYELWNALKLKSSNQLRMYEILKQYEFLGERVIEIEKLKNLMGIDGKDYKRYDNFKIHVLDVCQKALLENTDICYTYEPVGKKGKGGKILTLKFKISKNDNFNDQLTLSDFLNSYPKEENPQNEHLLFFADACNNEFNDSELQVLYNLIIKVIPFSEINNTKLEMYDYLKRKFDELNYQSNRRKITSRFGYLKKMIEIDID